LLSGAAGNPLTFSWNNGASEYDAASGLTLTTGAWHFAVAAYAGTSTTLYLSGPNGLASYVIGSLTDNSKTPSAWYAGYDSAVGGRELDGEFCDLRIYNRALSSAEVWALYDPRTRWDLYQQPTRRLWIDTAAAPATGGHPQYLPLLGVA
jgi:hypothetical protein